MTTRRRGPAIVLAAGLALLAWQIIVTTSTPQAALVRQAENHIGQARDRADWPEVARLARRALKANPLDTRALVLLALAAEAEDEQGLAVDLVSLAGARSQRDAWAHLWLFELRLNEGEFASALEHADLLLRAHPRLKATLSPYLVDMATEPGGRAAIVEMLATGPPWRSWFLNDLSRQAVDPSAVTLVYTALQSGPRPPISAELRPHLQRLIDQDQFDQALLLWLGSLPPGEAAELDYLHNGAFARPITNLAFDWVIGRVSGADIDIVASPMGAGRALRVQFGKGRVAFRHVAKLMTLPPGSYELTARAMAVDLGNGRGLRWSLACAEGQRQVLVATAGITGTLKADIAAPFSVPASGCRAQWLRLEPAARIAALWDGERGTVWFDSLQVRRTGQASPAARSRPRRHSSD